MNSILIWDIPIRVFHWLFAFCCVVALAIGSLAEDNATIFPMHMLFGLAACFLLVVRLALGVFGSRHNRFKALLFSSGETFRYFLGVMNNTAPRYVVHNPGTSIMMILMCVLVSLLVGTGIGASYKAAKEMHETLAGGVLALILFHLAGLAVHTIRHRENIALSMITGHKQGPPNQGLQTSHPIMGAVIFVLSVLWIGALFINYDSAKRTVTLPMLGNTVHIHPKSAEADD
jgi:cytochrome b